MLNPFPELLYLSFFAPTLLRVAAAICIGYTAYYIFKRRDAATEVDLPIIGKPAMFLVWFVVGVNMLVAIALFFGYGTQIAAIVGGLIALKYGFFLPKRIQNIVPLSRGGYLLVFIICMSLLISGAGQLAMDIRL